MRKWAMRCGIVVLIVAVPLLLYDQLLRHFDDGAFALQVHVVSKTNRRIIRVEAVVLNGQKMANDFRNDPTRFGSVLDRVNWNPGSPFTVNVPFGGEYSGLGREISYGQCGPLGICIEYADGQNQCETFEIPKGYPDGAGRREITVEVP